MALLTLESKRERVDKRFSELVKKKYPGKSFRAATKEMNKILEDLLFTKK